MKDLTESVSLSRPGSEGLTNAAVTNRRALTESIADRLTAMYARRQRAKGRAASWHGASMAHFLVLVQLAEGDGVPMTALARTLDVSLPSMTGIADRMASRGLVERVHDPDDRRVVRCRLTGAGRERLAEVESMQRDKIACVLGHLSDSQLDRLEVSLTDLMGAFAAAEACGDLDAFDKPTDRSTHTTNQTQEVPRQ